MEASGLVTVTVRAPVVGFTGRLQIISLGPWTVVVEQLLPPTEAVAPFKKLAPKIMMLSPAGALEVGVTEVTTGELKGGAVRL